MELLNQGAWIFSTALDPDFPMFPQWTLKNLAFTVGTRFIPHKHPKLSAKLCFEILHLQASTEKGNWRKKWKPNVHKLAQVPRSNHITYWKCVKPKVGRSARSLAKSASREITLASCRKDHVEKNEFTVSLLYNQELNF